MTWSFFLVHLKNCSLNFLFWKKVLQQSDSLLRYWRPIQPFYPPRILVRFVVKTTKETQKLLINTLLILQFEPFLRGDLENFFFLLPLATLWKYLRVVTPSLTHFTLVLCLKCTSSLCSNSLGSIFLTSLNATNLLIKALSLSWESTKVISFKIASFFSFISPEISLLQNFNFALMNYILCMNLWPSLAFNTHIHSPIFNLVLKASVGQPHTLESKRTWSQEQSGDN